MNLRFLEREGEKILQVMYSEPRDFIGCWEDVPTVKEPRKAREPREWFICPQKHHCAVIASEFPFNARPYLNGTWIRVQEVIEKEGDR